MNRNQQSLLLGMWQQRRCYAVCAIYRQNYRHKKIETEREKTDAKRGKYLQKT